MQVLDKISKLPSEIVNISLVIIIYFLVKFIIKLLFKKLFKDPSLRQMYTYHIVKIILLVITIMQIMTLFKTTSRLLSITLMSSGVLVTILGFAAQHSLGNLIDGLMIIIFKPYEVGDRIHIQSEDVSGIVYSISPRHTVIQTYQNTFKPIPNSIMNSSVIENFHVKDPHSRNFIDITIAYDANDTLAIGIMKKCIASHPKTLTNSMEEVTVLARELADSGVVLRGDVWTENVSESFIVCSDLRLQIKNEFITNGIEIPFPCIQVYMKEN